MRPVYHASKRGTLISIDVGTRGADLLGGIRVDLTGCSPQMRQCIEVFAEQVFETAVQTAIMFFPFGKNHLISPKTAFDQVEFNMLLPARLEHVLAYRKDGPYRTGSACRLIPAFGLLQRNGRSDFADFPVLDEGRNTLRFDRLLYNEVSSDLSEYVMAAVPIAE